MHIIHLLGVIGHFAYHWQARGKDIRDILGLNFKAFAKRKIRAWIFRHVPRL